MGAEIVGTISSDAVSCVSSVPVSNTNSSGSWESDDSALATVSNVYASGSTSVISAGSVVSTASVF